MDMTTAEKLRALTRRYLEFQSVASDVERRFPEEIEEAGQVFREENQAIIREGRGEFARRFPEETEAISRGNGSWPSFRPRPATSSRPFAPASWRRTA